MFSDHGWPFRRQGFNALVSLCKRRFGQKHIVVLKVMLKFRQLSCLGRFIRDKLGVGQIRKEFLSRATMLVLVAVPRKHGDKRIVALNMKDCAQ